MAYIIIFKKNEKQLIVVNNQSGVQGAFRIKINQLNLMYLKKKNSKVFIYSKNTHIYMYQLL